MKKNNSGFLLLLFFLCFNPNFGEASDSSTVYDEKISMYDNAIGEIKGLFNKLHSINEDKLLALPDEEYNKLITESDAILDRCNSVFNSIQNIDLDRQDKLQYLIKRCENRLNEFEDWRAKLKEPPYILIRWINNFEVSPDYNKIRVFTDDLENGSVTIRGVVKKTFIPVKRIEISKDNGITWEEIPPPIETWQYNFTPEPKLEYNIVVRIITTETEVYNRKQKVDLEYTGSGYTLFFQKELERVIRNYENEDRYAFIDSFSSKYWLRKDFLRNRVDDIFRRYDNIKVSAFILRISPSPKTVVVTVNWLSSAYVEDTGEFNKEDGVSTITFVYENEWKILAITGSNIFKIPENISEMLKYEFAR